MTLIIKNSNVFNFRMHYLQLEEDYDFDKIFM